MKEGKVDPKMKQELDKKIDLLFGEYISYEENRMYCEMHNIRDD